MNKTRSETRHLVAAVDDSEVRIGGRAHTILAGLIVDDEQKITSELCKLREELGLSQDFEFKWNSQIADRSTRERLTQLVLPILNTTTALILISEGVDRQVAAAHFLDQLHDALEERTRYFGEAEVEVLFDEGIIRNPTAFSHLWRSPCRPRLAKALYRSVKSHIAPLVQCADLFAGFQRLAIELAFGRDNPSITVFDDGLGSDIDIDLRNYVLLSLRYAIWGSVPPHATHPDAPVADGTWPFRHAKGMGLRIHSTVDDALQQHLYDEIGVVYIGCLH